MLQGEPAVTASSDAAATASGTPKPKAWVFDQQCPVRDVLDRLGELGASSRLAAMDGGARRLALEAQYARPLLDGRAGISAFVRAEAAAADGLANAPANLAGGRFHVNF